MKKATAAISNATIVAEVSATWVNGRGGRPISMKFEGVIAANAETNA